MGYLLRHFGRRRHLLYEMMQKGFSEPCCGHASETHLFASNCSTKRNREFGPDDLLESKLYRVVKSLLSCTFPFAHLFGWAEEEDSTNFWLSTPKPAVLITRFAGD